MSSGPLIGRDGELDIARAVVDRVQQGSGGALLIEGEAGIGKSSLLNTVLAGTSAQLFRAGAHELERERPLGLVLEALRSADDQTAHAEALRLQQLLHEGASGFVLSDGAVDLLERASLKGPLLLALEDLHWADAASLTVVGQLIRRLDVVGVGVLATSRPAPRSSELNLLVSMIELAGGVRIGLGPLDADAAHELARRESGGAMPEGLGLAVERAGGNPLYITELVHAMREEQSIGYELPPSLRLMILRRLSHLSQQTLDILRLAAVLGEEFAVADLCAFAGRTAVEMEPLLREASTTGVLRPTDQALAFHHELVRDAVYQDAPLPVRRALHAQAGHALARLGAPASRVAAHLSLGDDPDAVGWLRRTAQEANDVDPNVSVTLLRRALDLLDARDPERIRVSTEAAIGLVYASRPNEALELARDTLAMGPDDFESAVRLRHAMTSALVQLGRHAAAAEVWAECVPTNWPDDIAAGMLASRANIRLKLGAAGEAVADARQAIALGKRAGDPRPVVWGSLTLAERAFFEGDLQDVLAICAKAPTDASLQTALRADLRPHLHFVHTRALTDAGLFEEAETASRLLRDIARKSGRNSLPNSYGARGERLYRAGEWVSAQAELETGLDIALEQGPSGRPFVASTLLRLAVHLEEANLAERAKGAIDADLAGGAVQPQEIERCRWALAAYDKWRGAGGDAPLRVSSDLGVSRHIGALEVPDRIKGLVADGATNAAEAMASALERVAARPGSFQTMRALALRARGLASSDGSVLTEAVTAYRQTPLQLELTQTCEDAGSALAGSGAVELLEEARSRFESMGAVRDVRRVEAALRERGVRRGRRGARSRPSVGWDALTPTEVTVVEKLCEGLTNRQVGERLFISTRTVDSHVSRVFRKLGVSSRTELVSVAVVRRQQLREDAQ
jgi:DNA-binding NarL/FixJ family response regulator